MTLLALLLLQAVPLQIQVPGLAAAEARVGKTGEAWGLCIAAEAKKRGSSSSEQDQAVADAALVACPAEESELQKAWRDYMALLGVETSDAQLRDLILQARREVRPRLLGCLQVARSGAPPEQMRC